jgi:hypothetical protein
VAFAVGDDVAQVIRGCGGGFFGDERRPSKVAALGGFTVTLRAVSAEEGSVVRVALVGGVSAEAKVSENSTASVGPDIFKSSLGN